RSVELECGQMLALAGDVEKMRRVLLGGPAMQAAASPLPEEVGQREQVEQVEQPVAPMTATLGAMDAASLVEKTQEYLRRQCAELLKLPAHKIDAQAALENYGIDSILAMKLTNQLEKTFGSLSKTLFFEYQNIGELSQY